MPLEDKAISKLDADMREGETLTEEDLRAMLDQILSIKESRNKKYKNSPFNILPDSYYLAQIVVKATRAEQCVTVQDRIDELDDVIIYSLLERAKSLGMRI